MTRTNGLFFAQSDLDFLRSFQSSGKEIIFDVKNGNFILAGHSGTGWKAFFNELYRLETNDQVQVSYKGKKYTYSIVNIYKQPKVGTVSIYRNYDKTTLTLITCTNYDNETQTIYIAELISIDE